MKHSTWIPLIKEAMRQSAYRSVNAADSADSGYMMHLDFAGLHDEKAANETFVACRHNWEESKLWFKYLKRCARIMSKLTGEEYTVTSQFNNREITVTEPNGEKYVCSGGPFLGKYGYGGLAHE